MPVWPISQMIVQCPNEHSMLLRKSWKVRRGNHGIVETNVFHVPASFPPSSALFRARCYTIEDNGKPRAVQGAINMSGGNPWTGYQDSDGNPLW